MSTILSSADVELVRSGEDLREYWAITPARELIDDPENGRTIDEWMDLLEQLPEEFQTARLAGFMQFETDEGEWFDGWVLRR